MLFGWAAPTTFVITIAQTDLYLHNKLPNTTSNLVWCLRQHMKMGASGSIVAVCVCVPLLKWAGSLSVMQLAERVVVACRSLELHLECLMCLLCV